MCDLRRDHGRGRGNSGAAVKDSRHDSKRSSDSVDARRLIRPATFPQFVWRNSSRTQSNLGTAFRSLGKQESDVLHLSKIGEFFITPAHAGLFLTAFGVALLFTRFARGGRTLATIGVVALLVMSFSPLGAFLALPLENRFPPPPEDLTAPDGVVVLGGAFDEYISMMRGRISFNEAAERLTAAVGLSRCFP
jgi:hypothetical protein